MKRKYERVYQFRITLIGIEPPIWRRIQVPEIYTFWELHSAIQDVMGWEDYHLHEFEIKDPKTGEEVRIGIPHPDFAARRIRMVHERKAKIRRWFTEKNKRAVYVYDFGDNWRHEIILEGIFPREKGTKYPLCIAGERACPPEDCGGVSGYYELLEAIRNPLHPRHRELIEWLDEPYHPEDFHPENVHFTNPETRWRRWNE